MQFTWLFFFDQVNKIRGALLNPFPYPHLWDLLHLKLNLISFSLVWNITCRTCLLQCCPCNWCKLQSFGRRRQHVRYTGRVGSLGSPSDLPGICHSVGQTLLDGTGTDQWTYHKVESQRLPSCNHRLGRGRRGIKRGTEEAGERGRGRWKEEGIRGRQG